MWTAFYSWRSHLKMRKHNTERNKVLKIKTTTGKIHSTINYFYYFVQLCILYLTVIPFLYKVIKLKIRVCILMCLHLVIYFHLKGEIYLQNAVVTPGKADTLIQISTAT